MLRESGASSNRRRLRIEPRGRGVLDHPLSRMMTMEWLRRRLLFD
jgi:hypothetical protein